MNGAFREEYDKKPREVCTQKLDEVCERQCITLF